MFIHHTFETFNTPAVIVAIKLLWTPEIHSLSSAHS